MVDEAREFLTEWPIRSKRKRTGQNEKLDLKARPTSSSNAAMDEEMVRTNVRSHCCDRNTCCTASHSFATAALAKWWRRNRQSISDPDKAPKSNNPNTILKYVASLPMAKRFMEQRVQRLEQQIILNPCCGKLHAVLGSFHDTLRNLPQAVHHLSIATELDSSNKETRWLLTKVKRDKDLQDKKRNIEKCTTSKRPQKTLHMPEPIEVERHHYSSLSVQEFFTKYCLTSIPVIITGLVQHMTAEPWTLEHIKKVIGHIEAPLRKTVKDSAEWAKLEPADKMTVAQFIDTLHCQTEPRYLFDWSLPTFAPELARELTIPKYFAEDFLQRTTAGSLYQDSWPSLFVAPEGLHSELHVDAFGSNFWMALFQGTKRWTFFDKEDTPLLYPHYEQSLDVVFNVDLSSPDLEKHPLLSNASPRQCVLKPGELLFVPHGSPHRVENLDDSLAISANFVDLSNYYDVLDELTCNALLNPRSENLLSQLQSSDFPSKMNTQQEDLVWDEFKKWPREDYELYDVDLTILEQKASSQS